MWSAGTTPCSVTTSRPSATASRPLLCSRNSATVGGRPTPGPASDTPTTTSPTTPTPPTATSRLWTCTGTSATATGKPTPLPGSAMPTTPPATPTPPAPPGPTPWTSSPTSTTLTPTPSATNSTTSTRRRGCARALGDVAVAGYPYPSEWVC